MNPPPPAYHTWRNFLYQGTEKVRWAQADLVAPSAPPAPLPLIVSLHGGGWVECDKDMMGWDDALRWVKDGFAFARINYHLAREGIYPAAWHDVGKALAYLAAEAQTFGIDPARIGVIGASAGAHLAALACARPPAPRDMGGATMPKVAALGLLIGVFDLVAEQPRLTDCIQKFLGGEAQATPQLREEASPLYQLHADLPPTLMVQVSEDPVCPHIEAEKMRARLAKLQVTHRLHTIKGNQHELSPQDAHPPVRDWMREHL